MVILIVDSSGLIVERIVDLLSESSKRKDVYRAVSYLEAKKFLEVITPDIILLDIYLPINKSIDLLREVKESNAGTQVIIMLVAELDIFNKTRFQSMGADLFLDKYHEFEKIPAAIDTIFIEKRLRRLTGDTG